MQEKAVALGMEIANTLEMLYNAINDNQPVDPRFRHLVGEDILEKIAQYRASLSEVEVEMPDEEAPKEVPEGMVEHTITEEDIKNNPGIENDVKPGDEVLLTPPESVGGQESSQEAGNAQECTQTPSEAGSAVPSFWQSSSQSWRRIITRYARSRSDSPRGSEQESKE